MYYRTKTIRRQPIINGGLNVEIGNPSYNMYEVGHNHSERSLSEFTLNPEKVNEISATLLPQSCSIAMNY